MKATKKSCVILSTYGFKTPYGETFYPQIHSETAITKFFKFSVLHKRKPLNSEVVLNSYKFLKILDKKYPSQDKIRIILDNHSAHTSKETKNFLATMPEGRFEFVFTPKHGSWLNMIESFFGKMTKQMLRGIRVSSKQELIDRIYLYFQEINKEPVVYHWKYKMDEISEEEIGSI